MGARGPQPTPTAVLEARGSTTAIGRKNEPRPGVQAPVRPKWLPAEAQAAWDYLVPLLVDLGVLSLVDQAAVATWCTTWAHWRRCVDVLERDGLTYAETTREGHERLLPRPEVAMQMGYAAELRQLGDRLGLSPAARARLNAVVPADPGAKERPKPKPWQVIPGAKAKKASG